jgi:hypothetical protein
MKFNRFISQLANFASMSSLHHKHAAVIVRNGKPIAFGINSIRGNDPCHAECAAITKYLSLSGSRGPYKLHPGQECQQEEY